MSSNADTDTGNSVLKLKVMIINTVELKKILDDEDFDGVTFQASHATGSEVSLIAYKHFSSKKKQEQITDPQFFVNSESVVELGVGDDGMVSHFGNLKLKRSDLKEDIDTERYPYLVLWPEHGDGDFKNYIVYESFYTNDLKAAPQKTQALSRGLSTNMTLKPINPSPPA